MRHLPKVAIWVGAVVLTLGAWGVALAQRSPAPDRTAILGGDSSDDDRGSDSGDDD